jgi:predicted RNase H-like HicB family nuclease
MTEYIPMFPKEEAQNTQESHIKDFDTWIEKRIEEDKDLLIALSKTYSVKIGQFLVSIIKEDDFWIARCSELNVTSQGETFEDAIKNIKEAIESHIESFGNK